MSDSCCKGRVRLPNHKKKREIEEDKEDVLYVFKDGSEEPEEVQVRNVDEAEKVIDGLISKDVSSKSVRGMPEELQKEIGNPIIDIKPIDDGRNGFKDMV